MSHFPLFARCAVETWTAFGPRGLQRLDGLLDFYAESQGAAAILTPELRQEIRSWVAKYL